MLVRLLTLSSRYLNCWKEYLRTNIVHEFIGKSLRSDATFRYFLSFFIVCCLYQFELHGQWAMVNRSSTLYFRLELHFDLHAMATGTMSKQMKRSLNTDLHRTSIASYRQRWKILPQLFRISIPTINAPFIYFCRWFTVFVVKTFTWSGFCCCLDSH